MEKVIAIKIGKLDEFRESNNRHPTYRPAGSLLDIVAVSRPDYLLRAGVTRCHYGTPHDYTRAVLQCTGRTRVAGPVTQRRRLGRIDADSFNRQLNNIDWSPVFRTQLTASKWESFCDIFLGQLDTVAPVTRVQQRPPGSLLVSAPTRDLMARRRQALRPGGDRENYKELNRLCRAAVRKDQQAHINRELAKAGPSKVWRVLRPIIGSKKEAAVPSATPDALNDYYVSIGPITAASVPPPTVPVPVRLPRVTTSRFRPQPIDMDTLGLLLLHMKPSTSTGNDGISVSMFRTFFWGMGHVLLDIVNSSLTTSNVPGPWKHAMVTPIPKGQGPSEPANTRPISILPAIMEVVERVVQRQLVQYLEANQLLSTTQHGYRSGRSTETALSVITDRALEAMDAGEVSILVLLDLSKCFDVVPHGRLLDKLALYGLIEVRGRGPRIAQLKRLTGRDWGLREQQLRAVANGYVRGPQEHAAAAWLPATPASHVEILEREVRAAARVITGCPVSTRTHALLAEAGMPPVSARRLSLAARFLAKARALPREDPLRTVADEVVPARLSSVTGWRQCPALMNARLRIFGTIFPSLSDVRRDDAVAALARVARDSDEPHF
ncbi:putative RNA-directed DNA polymerase from transposon X-element [Amphibalanus amphitrite]|uniref:Putative RNA-directed DNA polymerase from transposon X-element n=1 Tax=Amphibalanus amphitrite TaxID=1232801 RepID=A0A6A4XHI8_AMPAM|nr:putative RNA-directed DNA polymerase from transposon X-element [Amphibalanus amphitrite]